MFIELPVHKTRSIGASILLILLLAVLSYFFLSAQYQELLQTYQSQGERAYVLAFIEIFLHAPLSASFLIVALPATFLLSLLLLKSWGDGLFAGIATGIIVSLLSLYITRTYFPGILAAGGLSIILEKVWIGTECGFIMGLAGALGGAIRAELTAERTAGDLPSGSVMEKPSRCPKCGFEFESNPKICSNCGQVLRGRHRANRY